MVKNLPQHLREAEKNVRLAARKGEKEGKVMSGEKETMEGRNDYVEGSIRVKEVEAVVFIPAMAGSMLRKTLQEKDENLCKIAGPPTVRFVETCGPTILDQVGRNNP